MAERWFVCASGDDAGVVREAVRALHPGTEVLVEESPGVARARMLAQVPRHASAVVGPVVRGVTPVNLAATLVADGHADEVVLVDTDPSGSLRSRAVRAGISRVLGMADVGEAVRAAAEEGLATGPSRSDDAARTAEEAAAQSAAEPVVDSAARSVVDSAAKSAVEPTAAVPPPSAIEGLEEPDDVLPSVMSHPLLAKRVPRVAPRGRDAAPVLVVASGRGGVGKSSVVALAACRAASWGMRVAVLDLDLGSGNLFGMLGLQGPVDLAASADADDLGFFSAGGAKAPIPGDGEVHLWGPCARPEMAETVSSVVEGAISALANEYDLLLIDTSTTWTDAVAQAAQACDRLLLVSDDRLGAVGSLSRTAALAVRLGVARTRIMRASNRCGTRARDEAFLYRADVGLEAAQAFRLLDGGEPVAELLRTGHAGELAGMRNDFSESVATWLAKVLEELGRLPECEDATESLSARVPRRGRGLFARMGEAG